MSVVATIELSCNDPAALCLIFVEGVLASMGPGAASAPIRAGQQVRWFVRPRSRRTPSAAVRQVLEGVERVLFEGRCDGGLGTGLLVAQRMRRSRKVAVAVAAPAPALRVARKAAARGPGRPPRSPELRGPTRAAPRAAVARTRRSRS